MRRHVAAVALLWVILTAALVALAQFELMPEVASDKGEAINHAFNFLLLMALPVFAFVVAVVGYSVVVFRRSGTPPVDGSGDGVRLHGRGAFPLAWFAITSALTLTIMTYPGLTELPKLAAVEQNPDLVVQVEGFQWAWQLNYPDQQVKTTSELVLPVDRLVRFDITSRDVVHAFWVPAFNMKIDAVPGLTTQMSLRTTAVGDYREDSLFRLQCSQLCGGAHAIMRIPVRVVTAQEFETWVADHTSAKPSAPPATLPPDAVVLDMTAQGIAYDKLELEVRADEPFAINFQNLDPQPIPHDIDIRAQDGTVLRDQPTIDGGQSTTYVYDALPAGTYTFICSIHPIPAMTGTLTVK